MEHAFFLSFLLQMQVAFAFPRITKYNQISKENDKKSLSNMNLWTVNFVRKRNKGTKDTIKIQEQQQNIKEFKSRLSEIIMETSRMEKANKKKIEQNIK